VRAAARGIRMGLMPHVVVDYYLTWFNGVFRRRLRIAADMVAINCVYGDASDILHCVWRKFNPCVYWLMLAISWVFTRGPLGAGGDANWRASGFPDRKFQDDLNCEVAAEFSASASLRGGL